MYNDRRSFLVADGNQDLYGTAHRRSFLAAKHRFEANSGEAPDRNLDLDFGAT
jgi:hypothetical protein